MFVSKKLAHKNYLQELDEWTVILVNLSDQN